jgi:hypothetical protein
MVHVGPGVSRSPDEGEFLTFTAALWLDIARQAPSHDATLFESTMFG